MVSDVLHQILDSARRSPHHVAVRDADVSLTYGQLTAMSGRVAAALTVRGVVTGDRVVLLLQNSIDYVVAALASMWIGAIFVPLDATDPVQRLASLLRDCQPTLVITNGVMDESSLPEDLASVEFVSVAQLHEEQVDVVDTLPIDERPSYIIYTSGTTGTPKGVVIGSGAFESAVSACSRARGVDATTTTLCVSPFHFDGSFATLFTTLTCGGTLIVRPRESLLFARVFFNTVLAESVTYTGFTPSYLRLLASNPQFDMLRGSALKVMAMGGEALTVSDVEKVWSVAPGVRVFNGYGPTETTITVSQMEVTPTVVSRGVIPIGKPNPDAQFFLVDEGGNLVEDAHVPGELYIGGGQLMNGYWASPALTDKVIRTDVIEGQRVYKTGDIVYRDSQGDFVYVNRADRVIKRSGVRISLLEITDAFCRNSDVNAAASVAFDNGGNLGIVTFVEVTSMASPAELHRGVGEFLPPTMLPDRICVVESIPLTSSGKTDERRLLKEVGLDPWAPTPASPRH